MPLFGKSRTTASPKQPASPAENLLLNYSENQADPAVVSTNDPFSGELSDAHLPRYHYDGFHEYPSGPSTAGLQAEEAIMNGLPTEISSQSPEEQELLRSLIFSKLDSVVSDIDSGSYNGDEKELLMAEQPDEWQPQARSIEPLSRGTNNRNQKEMVLRNVAPSALSTVNYFSKVNLYANSRLPPNLAPMKLYLATFPLLSLATRYSEQVYSKPAGKEKEAHVDADFLAGTKAMFVKSVPMDDMNTIVFAVRGTQSFMDWATNLKTKPVSPEGFLDDPGNLCHSGFLTVAKKMIKPVASRLRNLIQEDPGRCKCSLLITGHSAGGAVAALLYSHMLSESIEAKSELSDITGFFKRVHCVTFGAPPVSLLPLKTPDRPSLRKSVFLSFLNEGDPVARAEKDYVRSLLDLYTTRAPGPAALSPMKSQTLESKRSDLEQKWSSTLTLNKIRPKAKKANSAPLPTYAPVWPVPEAIFCNAGKLVLLRSAESYNSQSKKYKKIQERMNEGVVAQMISEDLLRGVIWGDPVCHMMKLYTRRIEILATNAVMGRG